ncbi:MAG: PQQ-binding-like beta-propeller repeat protein [Haloarculaceae archaeon]
MVAASNGRNRGWQYDDAGAAQPPAVAGGRVHVASTDGTVAVLE